MRGATVLAAVVGAVAGAAAGWLAAATHGDAADPSDASESVRADAFDGERLTAKIERLDRSVAALAAAVERLAARDARVTASPEGDDGGTPEQRAERVGSADVRTAQRVSRQQEFGEITDADLELEADERHAQQTDRAGAIQRYRALLARGGSPAKRRRWWLRLGECLSALSREDEADVAFRASVESSTEDHVERSFAAVAVASRLSDSSPSEALRWLDLALGSSADPGEGYLRMWHATARWLAEKSGDADRLRREQEWYETHAEK